MLTGSIIYFTFCMASACQDHHMTLPDMAPDACTAQAQVILAQWTSGIRDLDSSARFASFKCEPIEENKDPA